MYMLAVCCTDKGGFLEQHKVGTHLNPLLLFGRLTVLQELSSVGRQLYPLESKQQSQEPLTSAEQDELNALKARWRDLPSVLDARVGATQSTLIFPFSLLQTAGNYAMEINKCVRVSRRSAIV
jgi:hypothetical protein